MHLPTSARFATVLLLAALASSCGDSESKPPGEPQPTTVKVTPPVAGEPWDQLSQWHLFADMAEQRPAERVVPYDVIAPLFSDYTAKRRFLYVPEGAAIEYAADGPWAFPEGSVLVKTFSYPADLREPNGPERLLETRLLVREGGTWVAHTYVWNAEQTEAVREVAGSFTEATFVDLDGETVENLYRVPNTNECKDCHQNDDAFVTLGGRTKQLDRTHDYGAGAVNQIDHLVELGYFSGAPSADRARLVDPFGDEDLSLRARSYLDANCSACHTVGGNASQSGLVLTFAETDPATQPRSNWGVCRTPSAAGGATCGNTYDIVPGDPDASIMICRMASTVLDERMPPLGIRLVHEEGVALISEWIASMPLETCQTGEGGGGGGQGGGGSGQGGAGGAGGAGGSGGL